MDPISFMKPINKPPSHPFIALDLDGFNLEFILEISLSYWISD